MAGPVSSVKEYFETLPDRFRKEAAKGVTAVFQFELSGHGGGLYFAAVDGEQLTVTEGSHVSPTVTLKMAASEYVKMANGTLNGELAFLTGKLHVGGDLAMAVKMRSLFPPGHVGRRADR
ncbi:MAG: SCP2 sterol-binding domain-containing protein [Deltaproteobacteria bacterium]|nr:SCP2 sterol-binding domain-containing protein [Deltaproteobacteria bacterium]